MSERFVAKYFATLQAGLQSHKFNQAFQNLKANNPVFKLYPTNDALCELLKPGNKEYTHKDEVMSAFLKELRRSRDIYPLINIMFWGSLYRFYCQRRVRVSDPEDLFIIIQCEFYESLINHNIERLPRKIDVNVFYNTKKRVTSWEKENILYNNAIKEYEGLCKDGYSPVDMEESVFYPEEMNSYLLEMFYMGVISAMQLDLILETLVYKRMGQKEWAEKKGIPYSTVRTLKHRAEKAIRQFEGKRQNQKEAAEEEVREG